MVVSNSNILNQNAVSLARDSKEYQLVTCYTSPYGKTICEGFKFDKKLKAELKKDSSSFKAWGVKLSDVEYSWEIKKPKDYDWFDERFEEQLTDPYGMNITGYGHDQDGELIPQETFTDCIITDTGRDFEGGIERSVKGISLGRRKGATI